MDEISQFCKMLIIWREIEHIYVDNVVLEDHELLDGLKNYGLLKLFMIPNMKIETQLLEVLVYYWDLE